MKVSVIIPARDAAATIAETFRSLQDQTHADWEAIVIDDGSTDDTAGITRRQAETDPRFRLVTGNAAGVSDARNKGLRHANADWILFLDADDWILPTHLEKLTGCLRQDPGVDGAYCGYARVAEDGTVFGETRWWQPQNLFEEFARTCLWTVHAVIVRKKLIDDVGGFLPGWKTCEDWDLWQRITRTGARFGVVDETLALYRMRQGSASLDATDMVRGAIATINRGHGPDPRVPNPKPEYAAGAPSEGAPRARLLAVSWSAALLIGHGRDGREALEPVKADHEPHLEPWFVASNLFWGVLLPTCRTAEAWMELLPEHSERIDLFLGELERISGAPFLARRARQQLEHLVMHAASPDSAGVLGRSQMVTMEVTEPLRDTAVAPDVERVAFRVLLEGDAIGSLHLPVCDGGVAAPVLADAIADRMGYEILGRYLERSVHARLIGSRHFAASLAARSVRAVTRLLGGRQKDFEKWALLSIDWVALLAELFDPRPGPGPPEPVDRLEVEIGRPIPSVRAARQFVHVSVTCGGTPVGWVAVAAKAGHVSAKRIRRAICDACGLELLRLAVREGIVGRPLETAVPLSEILTRHASTRDGTTPYNSRSGTWLFGGTPDNAIGTSASRRVQLPVALADDLATAFPMCERHGDGPPTRAFHAPECGLPPGPGSFDLEPPNAAPRLQRARDIAARFAERAVPALRRRDPHQAIADRLPILMYHCIADDGPARLSTWRIPPAQFEDQLRHLRDRGYYGVTLEQWRSAKDRRRQLRGRPILLTFDDGYQDFADNAWPLLRKYGFTAIVFLVADRIGRANDWDEFTEGRLSLMDWATIRRLQEEGVEFGAHTCTHPPLTALPPADVVREGLRARRVLEEGLGRPVRSMAYPYGDHDAVVAHLMGGCGYRFALTCRADVSRYPDSLLELPRLIVEPGHTLAALTQRIELRHGEAAE